ncbi:efflux RND transporter permease subunit [Noviherbaspirillum sedimenti]|uniref:RND family transporter n=1 Tax=Noviherbaspirillum sedimenti TaxID=2320865 RepID=A0A3A3GEG5_9BURK|nr:MMPL family transporter [Noviherbaspirillum sedimenti]RJG00626.1 RND family transporter [Noviherbaspirillum sedimenti]
MAIDTNKNRLPIIRDLKDFDKKSGGLVERVIFNNRLLVVLICAIITVVLGYRATKLEVNASFEQMIPQSHPYIKNYFDNKESLKGLGNSIRIVLETTKGDIFDPAYLDQLKKINDAIYLTPGVDRSMMRSLWMPAVRWTDINEQGFVGGPVMPFDYDGTPASVQHFKENVLKARLEGSIVGQGYTSSMIVVPLLATNAETGKPLDYKKLATVLEQDIRQKFSQASGGAEPGHYKIRIVGFAKLVGDLIEGLHQVLGFFAVSALIATLLIYLYTRDLRSTLLLVFSAACGVVWLLGLLQVLGYDLNPYSILVPFLIFAIGISHGAQKMNGVMQDIGRGTHKYVAARYTFRRLFLAGLTALLTNVAGFAVLMIIDIPVIRDLALTTSIGVLVLVFTKLFFIPVALSYIGVNPKSAQRSLRSEEGRQTGAMGAMWELIARATERRFALPLVIGSIILGCMAAAVSLTSLQIGDLDAGAPELRPESRYNRDMAYINKHYGLSSDQFAVIVKTSPDKMVSYISMLEMDRLASALRQLPGVLATNSIAERARGATLGMYEGDPRWLTLPRDEKTIWMAVKNVVTDSPELINANASVAPMVAYLKDHRADTLKEMVKATEAFAAEHNTEDRQFLLAAGSAGIEAVTNIVVQEANYRVLGLLYLSVIAFCFITFRSWRAVIVAIVPLLITSFLCEALMVFLGIGIKVATLPVIALGVGVGVDYALYLISVQVAAQRQGATLKEAYGLALRFTGKVVALIGVTMAAGVVTWVWSPIKFQADMGLLLTFMFLWNMIGALVLIPALSHFLLGDSKFIGKQSMSR